jgi:hypothetical protein
LRIAYCAVILSEAASCASSEVEGPRLFGCNLEPGSFDRGPAVVGPAVLMTNALTTSSFLLTAENAEDRRNRLCGPLRLLRFKQTRISRQLVVASANAANGLAGLRMTSHTLRQSSSPALVCSYPDHLMELGNKYFAVADFAGCGRLLDRIDGFVQLILGDGHFQADARGEVA